jgi:hypothetical protein
MPIIMMARSMVVMSWFWRGASVGLDVDQHLQGHQRIAQHQRRHRAAVDLVLLSRMA